MNAKKSNDDFKGKILVTLAVGTLESMRIKGILTKKNQLFALSRATVLEYE